MKRTILLLALIVVLWTGMGLRFHRLAAQSFWNDEGNSARLSERSLALIVEGTASDIHPPLYYLFLHGWRALAGDGEFGLRALSAFAGVLLVAVTFALGRWLGSAAALAAAALVALNPALVYYSQEARMYALLALWAALATLLFLRWRPWQAPLWQRPRWSVALAYILVAAAGLYTHYFFPVVLLAHSLALLWFVLLRRDRVPLTPARWAILFSWALVMIGALLLYLPWLPIFLRQAGGRAGDAVQPFLFLGTALRWMATGATMPADPARWPMLALLLLLLPALVAIVRPRRGAGEAASVLLPTFFLVLVVPLLFMLLAGTTRAAYLKFLVVAVPFLILLAVSGLVVAWRAARHRRARLFWRLGLVVLFAVPVWGGARSLYNLYHDPTYARADYRGIAATIAAADHPNAGIILDAPNQWEVFTYYHREGAPVYPLPRGHASAAAVAAELSDIAARHDRLYAVFWGEGEQDPQRLVESWLDANTFKTTETWVGDVRFVTYAVPREPVGTMETELDVSFGDAIVLRGYTLRGATVAPGDIVQVTLFWETMAPLTTRYKVFLHLLDAGGTLVAQRDAEPGGNMAPTTGWEPGEVVVDNHGVLIPPDAAPGRYELRLGLYPLGDPTARLPLVDGGDTLELATVTVR